MVTLLNRYEIEIYSALKYILDLSSHKSACRKVRLQKREFSCYPRQARRLEKHIKNLFLSLGEEKTRMRYRFVSLFERAKLELLCLCVNTQSMRISFAYCKAAGLMAVRKMFSGRYELE